MYFYSHKGILLKDHLRDVGINIKKCIIQTFITEDFLLDKNYLGDIGFILGIFHDFGKFTSFFQNHLNFGKKDLKSHHSCISAFICSNFIYKYLDIHKIPSDSLFRAIPSLIYMIIRRHHSYLISFEDELDKDSLNDKVLNEWRQLPSLFEDLNELECRNEICKIFNELLKEIDINNFNFSEWIAKVFNENINLERIWAHIDRLKKDLNRILRQKRYHYFFLILTQFFFSLLIEYDRISASQIDLTSKVEFKLKIEKYIEFFSVKNNRINQLRNEFFKEIINYSINRLDKAINDNIHIFSITGPTGIGKTFAGLKFSEILKEIIKKKYHYTPRILYFLPFTSIIDQNYDIISNLFKFSIDDYLDNEQKYLLKHHHLSEIIFKEKGVELENEKALLFTEAWESCMIISTFYQFFQTIFGYKSSIIMKFNKIINSIIILDEVQCFPPEYWLIIQKYLITLTKYFNTKIILLTATQPSIFEINEFEEVISKPKKYFSANLLNRIDFYFNLNNSILSNKIQVILQKFFRLNIKSIMFVANTIKESIEIVDIIREFIKNLDNDKLKDGKIELVYLSTNITPLERKERILTIKNFKENNNIKLIVVSTQLIEAGIDIDIEWVIRDFSPLDCLIQVAGRCNRNKNNDKGKYCIYKFVDLNKNNPFCEYIYDKLLLNTTKDLLENFLNHNSLPWKEEIFKELSDDYFQEIKNKISELINFEKIIERLKFKNLNKNKKNIKESISDFKIIEKDMKKIMIYLPLNKTFNKKFDSFKEKYSEWKNFWEKKKNKSSSIKKYFNLKLELRKLQNQMKEYSLEIPIKDYNKIKKKDLIMPFNVLKENKISEYYNSLIGFRR
ncbi:MAG: CRISPR-associated helicase Cas3' [Promethearchaeota archaeon]